MTPQLSQNQIELLYEAKRSTDPVVVERETIESLRAPLEECLEQKGIDGSEMNPEALAAQFIAEDDRSKAAESLSQQHVETGGNPDAEADDGFSVESLSAGNVGEYYRRRKLIDSLESRTPEHASELKEELAADMGTTVDELPSKKSLQKLIDK